MVIPADVPAEKKETFKHNLNAITRNSDRLFLFAGDQKIEHLHDDFHGIEIPPEVAHPEHLFNIAQQGDIGAFATQLGLIARYGNTYKEVNYIAKLNSKTNIIKSEPFSSQLWSVADVVQLQEQSELKIRGVGFTIYLGSEHEASMLRQAAQVVWQAHQQGLVAILWIYPRGKAVKTDNSLEMLAGSAGVANALGADVVKIKAPESFRTYTIVEQLHIIKQAAGNTKVICSGGKKIAQDTFLSLVEQQVEKGNIAGAAVGRNIFQHSLDEAVGMTQKLAKVIYT